MNDQLFSRHHGRLLDTQCSGLGSAWHRAAANRVEDDPVEDAHDGAGKVLRWLPPAVGVIAVAGYLLSLWLDDRPQEAPATGAIVGAPLAPAAGSSGPA